MVESAERNVGLLGHVLDLDAFVFVALQQRQARVNNALTACELIIGQQARRYGFGHLSLVSSGFIRRSVASRSGPRGGFNH